VGRTQGPGRARNQRLDLNNVGGSGEAQQNC
jgi:hypothetical protein